jgi:streptomycin 6-kinase
MHQHPETRAWLDAVPAACDALLEDWQLVRDGPPYAGGMVSYVVPVVDAAGTPLVLKIQWPHRECEHEAAALAAWDGHGAIRLVRHDPARHALLLERCAPGEPLHVLDHDAAIDAAVDVLGELLRPVPAAHPFDTLAREAASWAVEIAEKSQRMGHPLDRALVDHAIELAHGLASTQGEQVLLHQDLHAGNIVSAERAPWLAIDPKPIVGERELGAIALVRGDELGMSEPLMRRRLDQLASRLELDRSRVRDWAIVQTLAWGDTHHRWAGEGTKVAMLLAL